MQNASNRSRTTPASVASTAGSDVAQRFGIYRNNVLSACKRRCTPMRICPLGVLSYTPACSC